MILLRKAVKADIPALLAIYEAAKLRLKNAGIDQWQNGYPNHESATLDVESGKCFVATIDDEVSGTMYLGFEPEPTYSSIYHGDWSTTGENYGVIHRVAVSDKHTRLGVSTFLMKQAEVMALAQNACSLRCDTHELNIAMQNTLAKGGFVRTGIILLENNEPRIAFEKVLYSN